MVGGSFERESDGENRKAINEYGKFITDARF